MKLLAFFVLAILLTFHLKGLAQDGESAADSPQLPDLPSVERSSDSNTPQADQTRTAPELSDLPKTQQRRNITQEQLDQANKDKNWLLEGLKEQDAKAEAALEEKEKERSSIIDQVLNNNRQQMGIDEPEQADPSATEEKNTFQPALSTSAFEPLPQIESGDSLAEAQEKVESSREQNKRTWKAVDEKTGVPNVFFNPRTGLFESQPVSYSEERNGMEVEWQRQQRLQNQTDRTSQSGNVEETVLAFESQLIEKAKAENKLPENFVPNTSREDMTFNPSRLDSNNSPYLFANQTKPSAGLSGNNDGLSFQREQPSFAARQGNAAALAKLRMVEEERQKRFEDEQKPTILEIHTPRPTRSLEINPRFD